MLKRLHCIATITLNFCSGYSDLAHCEGWGHGCCHTITFCGGLSYYYALGGGKGEINHSQEWIELLWILLQKVMHESVWVRCPEIASQDTYNPLICLELVKLFVVGCSGWGVHDITLDCLMEEVICRMGSSQ